MRKTLLLLATLGCSISWASTYATTITIDLGPPERVTGEKIVSFSDPSDLQLNGQTVSLDLIFSGNGFVRLLKSTNSTFLLLPMLDVFGAGTINNPTGSATFLMRPVIQLVLSHLSEARSPLTPVEKLSALVLVVFSRF
jgi:hypothetical protein